MFKPTFFNSKVKTNSKEEEEAFYKLLMWLKGYKMKYNVHPCSLDADWVSAEAPLGGLLLWTVDSSSKEVLCCRYGLEPVTEALMARLYGIYKEINWDFMKSYTSKPEIWAKLVIWIAFIFQEKEKARQVLEFISCFDPPQTLPRFNDFSKVLIETLDEFENALETLESFELDQNFWLWAALKPKKVEVTIPKGEALTIQPSWVEDEAWELYKETRPWEAAEILNNVVNDVIKAAAGRVIICLARDFLWLYALLVERGVPAYLAVCSRLNIGDNQTLKVIQKELQQNGVPLTNCLFVDSQGRGSIYDWLRAEFRLPAENFAFLYSCSMEYKGICQGYLTREEVIDKIEHRLIHPVGRSHNWSYHHGLGWQPVWQERELKEYSVRCIQQVRALTCLHMGVSMAWNSCMGHTVYERTMGLTLAKDEFPEVYVRVTQKAWESIQKEGYKTLRETGYSKGYDVPYYRDKYEKEAFSSIVDPLYGYRDDPQGWAQYGEVVLKLDKEYLKFCTSTPGDSLVDWWKGPNVLPLAWTTHKPTWKNKEVQIHTFLPPQAFEIFE